MDIVVYGMLIITVILIGGIISIFLKELKSILLTVVLFLLLCFFLRRGNSNEASVTRNRGD